MGSPEPSVIGTLNAGIRLLLELSALLVFGHWGYSLGQTQFVKLGAGIGIPAIVAVVWAVFGSPAAPYRLDQPWRVTLEIIILGSAAVALYGLNRPILAAGFSIAATVNTVLLYLLGQS